MEPNLRAANDVGGNQDARLDAVYNIKIESFSGEQKDGIRITKLKKHARDGVSDMTCLCLFGQFCVF